MDKELEKVAIKYSESHRVNVLYPEDTIIHAFKEGAEWQKQQDTNKACKWLKENIWKRLYVCDGEAGFPTAEFLKDFRKAVED